MQQMRMRKIIKDIPTGLVKALLITVVNSLYCIPDMGLVMKSQEMEEFIEENDIMLPFSKKLLAAPETIELYK